MPQMSTPGYPGGLCTSMRRGPTKVTTFRISVNRLIQQGAAPSPRSPSSDIGNPDSTFFAGFHKVTEWPFDLVINLYPDGLSVSDFARYAAGLLSQTQTHLSDQLRKIEDLRAGHVDPGAPVRHRTAMAIGFSLGEASTALDLRIDPYAVNVAYLRQHWPIAIRSLSTLLAQIREARI